MIHIDTATMYYPDTPRPVLRGLSLIVPSATSMVVQGLNGSGKTSLLRLISGTATWSYGAQVEGNIIVAGFTLPTTNPEIFNHIGMLSDNPWVQLTHLRTSVAGEIELCLESRGWTVSAIKNRRDELIARFGLASISDRNPATLSGGELQRTALACAVAHRPELILLDDPELHLDPVMLESLRQFLRDEQEEGRTLIWSSHNEEDLAKADSRLYLELPGRTPELVTPAPPPSIPDGPREILAIENATYRYPNGPLAVHDLSLTCHAGEATALIGPNGAGKTTVARLALGLINSDLGRIFVNGLDIAGQRASALSTTIGVAFQNPGDQLFRGSVHAELLYGPKVRGFDSYRLRQAVDWSASILGFDHLLEEHPYDLTWSERRLLSIACIAAAQPRLLVLDEPTAGLDRIQQRRIEHLIEVYWQAGGAVLVITHDLDFAERTCHEVIELRKGRVYEGVA